MKYKQMNSYIKMQFPKHMILQKFVVSKEQAWSCFKLIFVKNKVTIRRMLKNFPFV